MGRPLCVSFKGPFWDYMDSNSMTPPLTSFLCAWQHAEGMDDLSGIKPFDKQ